MSTDVPVSENLAVDCTEKIKNTNKVWYVTLCQRFVERLGTYARVVYVFCGPGIRAYVFFWSRAP